MKISRLLPLGKTAALLAVGCVCAFWYSGCNQAGADKPAAEEPASGASSDVPVAVDSVETAKPSLEVSQAESAELSNKLLMAARAGNTAAVKSLLDRGADIKFRKNDGSTLLHVVAYYHGNTEPWVETARFLLDHGADVNAKDNAGKTPLGVCYYSAIADLLRNRGGH